MTDLGVRQDFTILQRERAFAYLDSASTALVPTNVAHEVFQFLDTVTVSSRRGAYSLAVKGNEIVEQTRTEVAKLVNALPQEISFQPTIAHCLTSLLFGSGWRSEARNKVVVVQGVTNDIMGPLYAAAKVMGLEIHVIPVIQHSSSQLLEDVAAAIDDKTALVVSSCAPVVVGTVLPVNEIGRIAHDNDVLVAVDATRAIGLDFFDVRTTGADIVFFSANVAFLAPPGVVIQWIERGLAANLRPAIVGSSSIANIEDGSVDIANIPDRFETGILDIPAITGLNRAVEYIRKIGEERIRTHIRKMVQTIERGLRKIEGVVVYGEQGVPKTLVGFNVAGKTDLNCHDVAMFLEQAGVAVRSGLLCAHEFTRTFHREGVVQASPHLYNDESDVTRLIGTLEEICQLL